MADEQRVKEGMIEILVRWLESDSRNEYAAAVRDLTAERDRLRDEAQRFGEMVLFTDSYGCENGPHKCLHHDARQFLNRIAALAHSEQPE